MPRPVVSPDTLIEGLLHNAQISGGQLLERRLAETAVWFFKNMEYIPLDNLASRQAFLQKSFWILLEIQALMLERMRGDKESSLWLPKGMEIAGDIKKFG
jgi:hypothetical protein